MLQKNASKKQIFRKVLSSCLLLAVISAGFYNRLEGQERSEKQEKFIRNEKPNLAEPFKKCGVFGGNNGLTRIVASDNESNIISTTDNFWIISVNPFGNLENWKTQAGGKIEGEAVSDDFNLFFITSFEDEPGGKIYTLNSISSKTGLTNWQKKLGKFKTLSLNQSKNKELLFLSGGESSLMAALKVSGEIIWTKEFSSPLVSVDASKPVHLGILLEDRVVRLSTKSGGVLDETRFKKNPVTSSVINGPYFLIGYSNGEIRNISAGNKENEEIWKIKTGAGISGIIQYDEEVLVTSLDNFIYLFSIGSGKLKWKKRVAGRINIKPLIFGNFALVVNSGDNSTSVLDLRDGRIVNQIPLEEDTYLSGQPYIAGDYIVLQTSRGLQFFINTNTGCK